MHHKFLDRGTGSARSAADYLMRETDAKNEVREEISVLRGDPFHVAAVADQLAFKHKYRSSVLAFHEDDKPSNSQINELLNEYEQVAFAGLDKDQYCFSAVQHKEKNGGVHIHILTARVEMRSGKSLNIAPPGWQKTYDLLRDKHNIKNNWKRPDLATLNVTQNTELEKKFNGTRASIRDRINDIVVQNIVNNNIHDRSSMCDFINNKTEFEVVKQSKNFITVLANDQRIRMKSVIYQRDFNSNNLNIDFDTQSIESCDHKLHQKIKERSEYNQKTYKSEPPFFTLPNLKKSESSIATNDKDTDKKRRTTKGKKNGKRDRNDISSEIERLFKSATAAARRFNYASRALERENRRVEEMNTIKLTSTRDELQRFKNEISLTDYIKSCGFEVNQKESSNQFTVLKRDDETYIVTIKSNAQIYFNKDKSKSGSIIDFAKNEKGLNLGSVRIELRKWLLGYTPDFSKAATQADVLKVINEDQNQFDNSKVLQKWEAAKFSRSAAFLKKRAIAGDIIKDSRFKDLVKKDENGNILFAHKNQAGLCGFEVRNQNFKGFSSESEKGLFVSSNINQSNKIVICESAIDCISHAKLHFNSDCSYISTSGELSKKQKHLLKKLMEKNKHQEFILAQDNDEAAERQIQQIIELDKSKQINFTRHKPKTKDFNDDLKKHGKAKSNNKINF